MAVAEQVPLQKCVCVCKTALAFVQCCSFDRIFSYLLVWLWQDTSYNVPSKVREQLEGVSSFSLSCEYRRLNPGGVRFCNRNLYSVNHFSTCPLNIFDSFYYQESVHEDPTHTHTS